MPYIPSNFLLVAAIPSSMEPPPSVLEPATVERMPVEAEAVRYFALLSLQATKSVAAKTSHSNSNSNSNSEQRRLVRRFIPLEELSAVS